MRFLLDHLWKGCREIAIVAPLLPIALASLAGSIWSFSHGGAIALTVLAVILAQKSWKWWIAILGVVVGVAIHHELVDQPVRESLAKPRTTFVDGQLIVGGKVDLFSQNRVGWLINQSGSKKVSIVNGAHHIHGEVLQIKGRFFVPKPERNPGTYSRLDRWRREAISGGLVIQDSSLISLRWQSAPMRWAESLRKHLSHLMTIGIDHGAIGREVILAMVLGEKPARDSPVSEAFRESGAMHVFAVSGLHVTLVGGLCWLVLSSFPIPRRVGLILVIFAMVIYSMITGARPSSVRAAIMAISFLAAFLIRRRPSLFNSLALSFTMVVFWNPSQVFEIGFQLSYIVLASIGLGVGIVYRYTGRVAELDPFFPARLLTDRQRRWLSLRQYFAALSASSVVAWLGSFPLMIYYFGLVTPIAIFSSLLLIPLTLLILGSAFFSSALGVWWESGGKLINEMNSRMAHGGFLVAESFSEVPGGHWYSKDFVPADWVVFDPADGGSASYLHTGSGAMVDVGGAHFFQRELRSIFSNWNSTVETVFVSHPDGDHSGALPELLLRHPLQKVVLPVSTSLSPSYREFQNQSKEKGCEIIIPKTGSRFDLSESVWLEILREGAGKHRGIADNRIMVMKVHWRGWKILVTGDLGLEDELDLLKGDYDLSADVILMGLHEWGVSGQKQFLDATGAQAIIVSGCRFLPEETPKPHWVEMVKKSGRELFLQEQTGAVLLNFTDDDLWIRSFLNPLQSIRIQK